MFHCQKCNYFSNRKYNLQRHYDNKHNKQVEINENPKNEQNVSPKIQNVSPKIQNVSPNEQNVNPSEQNVCPKCNKVYKTKKHLLNHQIKCKGVDELTCSRCMTSFTTRAAK